MSDAGGRVPPRGTRRGTRIAIAALALALLAVALWGYGERRGRLALQVDLENERQRAFAELLTHVENVGTLLGKSLVSASPRQSISLFSEVWRHASAAQANLGRLPLVGLPTERAGRFLSQVGDFAYSLSRQTARGAPVNDEQWQTLGRLQAQTRQLSAQLHDLQRQMRRNRLRFVPARSAIDALLRRPDGPPAAVIADSVTRLDRDIQQYPTMIYDGPFSDHLLRPEPLGLRPNRVSADEARRIALDYAPTPRGVAYEATVQGQRNGRIPVYAVRVGPRAGGAGPTFLIDVTQQGGHVAWMLSSHRPGPDGVAPEEARARAAAFLRQRDYPPMEPTYALSEGGVTVVTFAAVQDGVRLYPDLVKVRVARDTGDVTGVEALGFLMSHRPRALPRPALSAEAARARLAARAQVVSERLALIPLDTRAEVLAYEFTLRLGDNRFLVYINALTGDEEKVLQVIDGPSGTLTM